MKILITLLLLYCQQALAHNSSDSYLNIILSEHDSSINWSIAVRDLEYAVGLDLDNNSEISWDEVLQRRAEIDAYVLSRLSLYTTNESFKKMCQLEINNLLVDDKSDGIYLVFSLASPCLLNPSAKNFSIDYQLLFDIDKNHRGLILMQIDGNDNTIIASPEKHTFTLQNKSLPAITVFSNYVVQGVWHILIGLDHILFLLALLLPSVLIYKNSQWQQRASIRSSFLSIIKIVTAFTLAHSITLTLSVLKIVQLPSQWIEVVIAITVLLTCLHTIKPVFQHSLWKLAFTFGLIHGFGFANVLIDLGLAETALALSLLGFNAGVEIGQLFIVCIFLMFAVIVHKYWWYRVFIFKGGISLTAMLSSIWIYERIFNYELLPF